MQYVNKDLYDVHNIIVSEHESLNRKRERNPTPYCILCMHACSWGRGALSLSLFSHLSSEAIMYLYHNMDK
eukprot:COSAG05_NODE_1707_length_4242_cov_9.508086_2_plen_71_part_00